MKQGRSQTDVMGYRPPQGPKNIMDAKGPGLHGDNEGKSGDQNDGAHGYEYHQSSGRPGLGGSGNKCSQGRY